MQFLTNYIAHLYGNLMNTYGDNGNILMLSSTKVENLEPMSSIMSLKDRFDPDAYDMAADKTTSRSIYSEDLPEQKKTLEASFMTMACGPIICGGFQLLGQYYIEVWANVAGLCTATIRQLGQQPPYRHIGQLASII